MLDNLYCLPCDCVVLDCALQCGLITIPIAATQSTAIGTAPLTGTYTIIIRMRGGLGSRVKTIDFTMGDAFELPAEWFNESSVSTVTIKDPNGVVLTDGNTITANCWYIRVIPAILPNGPCVCNLDLLASVPLVIRDFPANNIVNQPLLAGTVNSIYSVNQSYGLSGIPTCVTEPLDWYILPVNPNTGFYFQDAYSGTISPNTTGSSWLLDNGSQPLYLDLTNITASTAQLGYIEFRYEIGNNTCGKVSQSFQIAIVTP